MATDLAEFLGPPFDLILSGIAMLSSVFIRRHDQIFHGERTVDGLAEETLVQHAGREPFMTQNKSWSETASKSSK